MSERETRIRTILISYFPMFIATLSLVTSIYNGYLNNLFVDLIQRNVGRTRIHADLQGCDRCLFPGQISRLRRQQESRECTAPVAPP